MKRFLILFLLLGTLAAPALPLEAAAATDTAAILRQLEALQANLKTLQAGHQPTPAAPCYPFIRSLTVGSSGADVKALQQFLNARSFTIATSGSGSPGAESTYFGSKTRAALGRFQAANNISPALGYFGPSTRARVISLCTETATFTERARQNTGTAGSGNAFDLPTLPPAATSTTILPPQASTSIAAITPIAPRSIAGILCTYRRPDGYRVVKGSGVIVHQGGYILTARHTVDPQWTVEAYGPTMDASQLDTFQNSVLERCEVGLPENATLPTPDQIRSVNPSLHITTHFQYRAEVYFAPERAGLSESEYKNADFAVLKITGATANCSFFNATCNEMGRFPYTPVLSGDLPQARFDEILSYGYPAELINREGNAFYDFYLKGSVGVVGNYFYGNQRFRNEPVNFSFDANDIQGGRSGSGLFYKGKVMGILYGSTSVNQSYNLSITVIEDLLRERGLGWILARE